MRTWLCLLLLERIIISSKSEKPYYQRPDVKAHQKKHSKEYHQRPEVKVRKRKYNKRRYDETHWKRVYWQSSKIALPRQNRPRPPIIKERDRLQRIRDKKRAIQRIQEKYKTTKSNAKLIYAIRMSAYGYHPKAVLDIAEQIRKEEGEDFMEMVLDGIPEGKKKKMEYIEQNKGMIEEALSSIPPEPKPRKNKWTRIEEIEYQREYYQKNKEKKREYYKNNKEKAREYYQKNKTRILEQRRRKYNKKNAKYLNTVQSYPHLLQ